MGVDWVGMCYFLLCGAGRVAGFALLFAFSMGGQYCAI